MSKVYVVGDDGTTAPMERVRCKDEDKELQLLLDMNPELLPGDQIRPEDPRRWLLVKREMPVPDPDSGDDRWNIDFLLVDQDGIPTFIECKRFLDTRSRRKVIGQMFDYAANARHFWTSEVLMRHLEQTCRTRAWDIDRKFAGLAAADPITSVDELIETMAQNLQQGQMRLVFFLEEAPYELRSIVEFLNGQMERTEVLLVEAKQYQADGMRVVASALFGYTEEARRIKRITVTKAANRRQWDEESFFAELAANVADHQFNTARELYDCIQKLGLKIKWGTGATVGAMNIYLPEWCPRYFLSVNTVGALQFPFPELKGTPEIEEGRGRLYLLLKALDANAPDDYQNHYPKASPEAWTPKLDLLLGELKAFVNRFRVA